MRLSEFIRVHMESILQAWENFARTIEPPALTMDAKALRNHASHMLNAIADDLDRAQTLEEEIKKSEGHGKRGIDDTAAETHAIARLLSGYSIEQLASEYRALRSSVLRLWAAEAKAGLKTDFDDITRFNEAIDQALAESIARYSKLFNQSRNLFLAILGHDLRNPLGTTINGAQMLMLSEDMQSRYRDIAVRIFNSGRRMSKLVDDLIDYTRTHLGSSLPIVPKPVDLAEIAENVVDEMRIYHPTHDIKFNAAGKLDGVWDKERIAQVIEFSSRIEFNIMRWMIDGMWDKERIAQVISNLVGNAVQHGASDKAIVVDAHSDQEEIVVTVNNYGPVIVEEQLQTIFEPMVRFVESDAPRPEKVNSLGLGLYIAREVVKSHGGSVGVASSSEDGTTFTVRLPRAVPADLPHRNALSAM